MADDVISVQNVCKYYGKVKAVDGISFCVKQGEIFGVVGPNGAGKTTAIECIAGMRMVDSGEIRVLGFDPQKQPIELKRRIGLQQQESEIPERLRLYEAMELFSAFYEKPLGWEDILQQLNLSGKKDCFFGSLSGGQKKRFFVALALIGDPEVVFLDELTSGLDPQSRRSVWKLVENLRDQGRTVVLSTHYMDEAEKLCDRVAVIDRGKITALDSPSSLVSQFGGYTRILFQTGNGFSPGPVKKVEGVESVTVCANQCTVEVSSRRSIVELVRQLDVMDQELTGFRVEIPTLEDVFLNITGREIRE